MCVHDQEKMFQSRELSSFLVCFRPKISYNLQPTTRGCCPLPQQGSCVLYNPSMVGARQVSEDFCENHYFCSFQTKWLYLHLFFLPRWFCAPVNFPDEFFPKCWISIFFWNHQTKINLIIGRILPCLRLDPPLILSLVINKQIVSLTLRRTVGVRLIQQILYTQQYLLDRNRRTPSLLFI